MRKSIAQKRKAWASFTGSKRVKFAKPKPREARIELKSLEVTEAAVEVAVSAPSSLVTPPVPITHPSSSSTSIEEGLGDSLDRDLPLEGGLEGAIP